MSSANNSSSSPLSSPSGTSHSLASRDSHAFLVTDQTPTGPTDNESDQSNDAQETVIDHTAASELLRPPSNPASVNHPDKSSIRNRSPSSNHSQFHGASASITDSTASLPLRDQNGDMRSVLKRKQPSTPLTLPPVPSPTQRDQKSMPQRGRTPVQKPDRQGKHRRRSSAIKMAMRKFLTLGKDLRHDNPSSTSFDVDDDKKFTVTPLIARAPPTAYETTPSRGLHSRQSWVNPNDASMTGGPGSRDWTDENDDRASKPDSFNIREPEPFFPDRGELYPDKGTAFSSFSTRPSTRSHRDVDYRQAHHINNTRNINNSISIDNLSHIPKPYISRAEDDIPRAISTNANPDHGIQRHSSKGSSLSLPDQSATDVGDGLRRAARRRSRSVTTFQDIFRHRTTNSKTGSSEPLPRQNPVVPDLAHPSASSEHPAMAPEGQQYDQATLKNPVDDSGKHTVRPTSYAEPWLTALDEPADVLAERVASLEVKLMDLELAMVRFQNQSQPKPQASGSGSVSGSKLPVPSGSTKRPEAESRSLPRKVRRTTASQGAHNADGKSNGSGKSDETPTPSPSPTIAREEYDQLVQLVHHERSMRSDLEGEVQSLRQDVRKLVANITANGNPSNTSDEATPSHHDSICSILNSENSCCSVSGINAQASIPSTAAHNGSFNFFDNSTNEAPTIEPPPRRPSHRLQQHPFATLPLPKNAHRPHPSSFLPVSHQPQLSVPTIRKPTPTEPRSRSPSVPVTSTVSQNLTASSGLKLLPPRNTDSESMASTLVAARNPAPHISRSSSSSEVNRERWQGQRKTASPRPTGASELSPLNRLHTYRSNTSLSRMALSTPTINEHDKENNEQAPTSPGQREMKITVKSPPTRSGASRV